MSFLFRSRKTSAFVARQAGTSRTGRAGRALGMSAVAVGILLGTSRASAQTAPAEPPSPPVPPPAPAAPAAPNRFEQSGDTWMAAGAYDKAVIAYERAYEVGPSPALEAKLRDARAGASRIVVFPPRAPVPEPPPRRRDDDMVAERKPPPKMQWYGYQPIIADSATLALSIGLAKAGAFDFVTLVPYALAGPIIHVVHGNYATAGIDVGVRVGMPIGAGLVGAGLGALFGAAGSSSGQGEEDAAIGAAVGAIVGFGAGIVGACVIDAAVLSYEPIKPPAAAKWVPTVVPIRGGAGLGLGGVF